jgi:voltage-gated potassium channel
MALQDFSFIDALYMTVITLTTVGFGEIKPLDSTGRLFTIALIMLGAGFVAYNIAYFTQLFIDGNLLEAYRRLKVSKRREKLKDHYIVCGYGQMGQIIAAELTAHDVPVLVIENDEAILLRLREKGILHIVGDATEEENLIDAGIMNAKGVVSVVSRDTDNVFIVLTARDLNREMLIYARSHTPGAEKKLIKAGADRVVSPHTTGAARIVHNILRPTVIDFLDLALSGQGMELSMEELVIPYGADLVGRDLIHSGIRGEFNLIIVAIKRCDGRMIYNPSPTEILNAGDILVAIGPQENLIRFANWLKEQGAPACAKIEPSRA